MLLPGHLHPLFVGDLLQTVGYNEHHHAYEVITMPQPTFRVFSQTDLKEHCVLSLYQPFNAPTTLTLSIKYYVLDEFDVL